MQFAVPLRESIVGRLIRIPLGFIPKGTVVPILSGPLRGSRWIVGSSVHACWIGTYELNKLRMVERFLDPGSVMYDVGANVGLYTLLGSGIVGSLGKVFAFEPFAENCSKLRRHLELNSVVNCQLLETAVADATTVRKFDIGNGALMGRLADTGDVSVPVLDLDSFWAADPASRSPQFVKIDVEGAELDVLRGATRLLTACSPNLFVATHSPELHAECRVLLHSLGYAVEQIDPNELLAHRNKRDAE